MQYRPGGRAEKPAFFMYACAMSSLGPHATAPAHTSGTSVAPDMSRDLRHCALHALALPAWTDKMRSVEAILPDGPANTVTVLTEPPGLPGRPARPDLVVPAQLKPRPVGTPD